MLITFGRKDHGSHEEWISWYQEKQDRSLCGTEGCRQIASSEVRTGIHGQDFQGCVTVCGFRLPTTAFPASKVCVLLIRTSSGSCFSARVFNFFYMSRDNILRERIREWKAPFRLRVTRGQSSALSRVVIVPAWQKLLLTQFYLLLFIYFLRFVSNAFMKFKTTRQNLRDPCSGFPWWKKWKTYAVGKINSFIHFLSLFKREVPSAVTALNILSFQSASAAIYMQVTYFDI